MSSMVPKNGASDALEYFVNRAAPEDLILRLFTNDISPADTDTAADYIEPTVPGYAPVILSGAAWYAPVEGTPASIAYPPQTFRFSGDGVVYGYYLTRADSGRLALSARDPAGVFTFKSGDSYVVFPVITAKSLGNT